MSFFILGNPKLFMQPKFFFPFSFPSPSPLHPFPSLSFMFPLPPHLPSSPTPSYSAPASPPSPRPPPLLPLPSSYLSFFFLCSYSLSFSFLESLIHCRVKLLLFSMNTVKSHIPQIKFKLLVFWSQGRTSQLSQPNHVLLDFVHLLVVKNFNSPSLLHVTDI